MKMRQVRVGVGVAHRTVKPPKRAFAKTMRRRPTNAERRLWRLLSSEPFAEFHFRRQTPIGDFIVDFVSLGWKLVVEVDGDQHARHAGIEADTKRDGWLRQEGYRVLRFSNRDVLTGLQNIGDMILSTVRPPPETGDAGFDLPSRGR